jgi:predicted nucleic acid-binding protein
MICLLDSSVLIASLVEAQAHHAECDRVLAGRGVHVRAHAFAEVFSMLTGGRLGQRITPNVAASLIEEGIVPAVKVVQLDPADILAALRETETRGVRGGAIYDFLHLAAARKCRATRLYTLNVRHFQAFLSPGDPEIVHP